MASSENDPPGKITLYWLDKSRSQRTLWLLEELDLTYTLQVFKRGSDMRAPASLKQIHPLGKSPVLGVQAPGQASPTIIAESGAIFEYLTDHWGAHLVPKRWQEGKEGKVGGETEAWMRYRQLMHYAEGSLMPPMIVGLIVDNIRDAPAPFFIKPITRSIASRIYSLFLTAEHNNNFSFLESLLSSKPSSGRYFCGEELSAADVMLQFPLEWALGNGALSKEKYPKLAAFVESNKKRGPFERGVKRVVDETGEYNMNFK